ncbi:DNA polymerase alpha/epsilon subunit B-domain-containing protein [Entophlyctis helioformis]|nr:DNA polymerase alpha/epsilon subunit B-domain-containing protein [Entophlyctis helioformis]
MVQGQAVEDRPLSGAALDRRINQQVYRIFTKKHGLKVSAESTRFLQDLVKENDVELSATEESFDYIVQQYVQQQGASGVQGVVQHDALLQVVQGILQKAVVTNAYARDGISTGPASDGDDNGSSRADVQLSVEDDSAVADLNTMSAYLHVVDAQSVPHIQYHPGLGMFIKGRKDSHLLAPAESRTAVFRERFELIKQRLLRNDAFRVPAFAATTTSFFQITPIIQLKGKRPGVYLLFGMLTSIQDGNYHLEDPDAFIQLEFTAATQQSAGMFTRNCFVLVQGNYTELGTFTVNVIGHPLPERRDNSLTAFTATVDYFGAPRFTEDSTTLMRIEQNTKDMSFVFISDVWLDQTRVLDKLRMLFQGFSDAIVPLAFVLMGNFSSTPYIYNGVESKRYREGFDNLADIIAEFPAVADQSHFVFVPGPHDPWAPNILPRSAIPTTLTGKLMQKVRNVHLSTAPCRLKYCTQEIVVFRDDLVTAMRRHSVLPVERDGNNHNMPIEQHLVQTVLDQSHLAPLPVEIKPRFWEHDHSLRLYPQPHLLILADKYDLYQHEYEGCLAANPGSFPNNGYKFLMYDLSTRTCEPRYVSLALERICKPC